MVIACDFDDCIVVQAGRAYDDVTTPLVFVSGALRGLKSLKKAGHTILVYSARSNRALRFDPMLDPLVRAGKRRVNRRVWEKQQRVHEARYEQMLAFVKERLTGLVDATDDGQQGKAVADLYIDDRALRLGNGAWAATWGLIAGAWGAVVYDDAAVRS